jgi:hypothetical protein
MVQFSSPVSQTLNTVDTKHYTGHLWPAHKIPGSSGLFHDSLTAKLFSLGEMNFKEVPVASENQPNGSSDEGHGRTSLSVSEGPLTAINLAHKEHYYSTER